MARTTVVLFIYCLLLMRTMSKTQTCTVTGQTGFMEFLKEGDLIIGGVFSMKFRFTVIFVLGHLCLTDRWNDRELKFARTAIFTVEEINRDGKLLPGVTLGYRLYNGCGSENLIRAAVEAVTGEGCSSQVQALLGHSSSGVSEDINLILSPFSIPQVSHLSTCACLSDKKKYPTFFRTVPSDHFQISGLVQLLKFFDWRWVGIVYAAGSYSDDGTAHFVKEAEKEGICVEYRLRFSVTSGKKSTAIVKALQESSSRVVLLFMSMFKTKAFLNEMENNNITDKQWLGSESWITQADLASSKRQHILQGAIGFALPQMVIPGLGDFLLSLKPSDEPQSDIVKAMWGDFFNCSFSPSSTSAACTGTEDLRTVTNDYTEVTHFRAENNVYKAVYLVAYALQGLLQCENGSNPTTGKPCVNKKEVQPKLVSSSAKKRWCHEPVPLQVPRSVCREPCPPGTRKAINKLKPVCCFDCFECPDGTFSNQTDSLDCFSCPQELWPNDQKNLCLPKPSEYLSYREITGALLSGFGCLGVFLSLLTTLIFLVHKETPIVKANNSELSFLLLLSLKLCFLCSLTFIGRPSDWSCMLRHTAFGITFVLCISCVLGKTVVVLMAFRATLPGSKVMKWFGPKQQRLTVLTFTLIQVVICILWLTTNPPFPMRNMTYYKDKIILECALGSAVGFWAVLSYIGVLAILCFILAFLARKLPDTFNEAKLITFSMLIFCAVWITFIPAYISSPGKFTVAVEIFAILASSFGLLLCIFFPKCYIIIFRPQKNCRKSLLGNPQTRTL
uniref:G-protein coupled receptors family 3 profile domain-containing protein n=1 Tax=Takifugu rubripes TaxID=31033 RepID=A0A3B5KMK1_TAKRU